MFSSSINLAAFIRAFTTMNEENKIRKKISTTSMGSDNDNGNGRNHLRHRRSISGSRASDIIDNDVRVRKSQPDHPIHCPKDSLLSSSSGYTNYRGLLNLCFIILVLSNARVALENIIKYGILIDPFQWITMLVHDDHLLAPVLVVLGSNVFILVSYCLERHLLRPRLISNRMAALLSVSIVVSLLSLPVVVFHVYHCNPVLASICCSIYSLLSLKLTSYHMVNYWCRLNVARKKSHARSNSLDSNHEAMAMMDANPVVVYPNNLRLGDIYYFMFAPTLCYELNFPRSERIRFRFLIKRILELIFLLQLDIGLIQQWMVPTIRNSLEPLKEMSISRMLERLLKLAVPNHLIWLIFFYCYFHSFLNVLAEVMRFADREFYRDWWNSESVNYFWQNWNIPVHRWCVRHVYVPLLSNDKLRLNRFQASTVVFFLSAFFHEYLVSVPLNMYRLWAFMGMIFQLPFSMLVSRYLNNQIANVAVWISLIIGQPLAILMYYHDYYVINIAQAKA